MVLGSAVRRNLAETLSCNGGPQKAHESSPWGCDAFQTMSLQGTHVFDLDVLR
jgi:hypothetical protein